MPDTKPDLNFDENGICDACHSHAKKGTGEIDWDSREKEFFEIVEKNRKNSGYDILIPVSGGKDPTYQTMKALDLGLKPLCVCFEPTIATEIGKRNLDNLQKLGVDLILVKKDYKVYKSMVLQGLQVVGDNEWPNHVGIFTVPVHFAVKFNIPLILWGESPQFEYGGPATSKENRYLNRRWLEEFGGLLGYRVEDMIGVDGITDKDLELYKYPSDEEIERVGVTGIFLGYFFKWDTRRQLDAVIEKGFEVSERHIETTYTNFENLDCYSMTIHDYMKYIKYGFGRATDHACLDIRNGDISREEGVRLANRYDGKYPHEAVNEFLTYSGLSKEELDSIFDSFTNRKIFESDGKGGFKKDIEGSLVKKEEYVLK
jgi:N-acetyl sugar amidotransferase